MVGVAAVSVSGYNFVAPWAVVIGNLFHMTVFWTPVSPYLRSRSPGQPLKMNRYHKSRYGVYTVGTQATGYDITS